MTTPNPSAARSIFSPALLLLLLLPCLLSAKDTIIRGRLAQSSEQNPSDRTIHFTTDDGQALTLVGDDYSTSQLADPELKDRYWELRGALKPDDVFEVLRLFTIKDGKLFRVTYFCVICNIRSHHHAPCMCCQDDTELEELPIDTP